VCCEPAHGWGLMGGSSSAPHSLKRGVTVDMCAKTASCLRRYLTLTQVRNPVARTRSESAQGRGALVLAMLGRTPFDARLPRGRRGVTTPPFQDEQPWDQESPDLPRRPPGGGCFVGPAVGSRYTCEGRPYRRRRVSQLLASCPQTVSSVPGRSRLVSARHRRGRTGVGAYVDTPSRETGRKSGILTLPADRERQLVVGHDDARSPRRSIHDLHG
jgi:hypothetical protein